MDQSTLDKRYGEDGKRTNICFTCNKAGHWARNCPDKEKQTWTTAFVYVNPYTHELKILPTWRLGHQFQNMRYIGVLKSFCKECKINSAQNTISVESQTKQTEKYSMQNDCENTKKMQNDNTPTKINLPQNTISVESQTEQTENMQNDNTSISDSEICQTAERLERLVNSLNIPKLDHYRSLFKPEKKNKINSQQKDLASSEEKEQDSKQQDSEDKKKKNCYFCKSKSMKIKSVQIY